MKIRNLFNKQTVKYSLTQLFIFYLSYMLWSFWPLSGFVLTFTHLYRVWWWFKYSGTCNLHENT